jgi:hypothetical protein
MQKGLLINSIIGFGVFVISFLTSFFLIRRKKKGAENVTIGYSLFWLSVGFLYFFVGLRTLSAYFSNFELDKIFFFVDNAFGGLMAPFIIYLFLYFWTENHKRSISGGSIFLIIWIVWVFVNLKGGVRGPQISYWQSEWIPKSTTAKIINGIGLFIPGFLSAIGIGILSLRLKTKISRFRALSTSLSIIIIAIVVLLDYWGAVGIPGRFLILLASFIALMGYNPPPFIKEKLEG